ncbi:MAG: endopeptidase La [Betaproteobacteria bacterium]|nr:MAG: endopeptidase La [Betaproteobacteria bacterium]TMI12321.1 MAG: endopeptidase La [Betaproteobacteria bacterium]
MSEQKVLSNEKPDAAPAPSQGAKALASRPLPEDALIVVPMRNMVLFPGVISPITIGRKSSVAAAQEAVRSEKKVGFLLQRDARKDDVRPDDLYWVGTAGQVVRYITGPEGAHHLVVQGTSRFRVLEFLEGWPFLVARVQYIETRDEMTPEIEARFLQLKERAVEAIQLLANAPEELAVVVQQVGSPGLLADMVANLLDVKNEDKQDLLETFELKRRLDKVLELLAERLGVLRISKEIGDKTKKEFDVRQREHVLREQMRQIQKELGEGEEGAAEAAELKKAIDDAGMPEDVHKHAAKELKRLQRMGENSAESSMLRTYLEWLAELPWRDAQLKPIDIGEARKVLDEDHYDLEKIKRRILEYLAVKKLNPNGKSPILCFVGPPGVGKTSLGQSIARATGRKFQRVSLGGVHDEAEIRGHRRTYIGALPGSIIQAIRRAESRAAVIMFDEIDKLGMGGFHGDPSSALLEVLDPEQNARFRDNYLGVDFDLSKVLFITTANVLDTIPGPLRDRMEIIQLPGYTEEEKLEIAKRYLVRRQLEANGLASEQAGITEDAIRKIISDYTREAGVRNLEREIGAALRSAAMQIAEGKAQTVVIEPKDLHAILGARKFEGEVAERTAVPGVATGLAWTPVGGDILFIEASQVPGTGKLILTGQLGDVMKESAQAALTLAKSFLGEPLDKVDIHIHVPAGATPKDGPSAGVAMFLALVSLHAGLPVRPDVAMTGEISLRGLVLPIGGVKEKTLAALRAGIKTVMLPKRNEKDLEDVPAEARQKLEFVFLEKVEEAVRTAIGELPKAGAKRAAA